MKRSIVTFAFVLLVGGLLFAASGDNLTLLTKVGAVKPVFEIYGKTSETPETSTKGTLAGANIDWREVDGKDPSANDIELSITLKHVGEGAENYIRYKSATTGIVLTVTAEALSNGDGGTTAKPTAGAFDKKTTILGSFEVEAVADSSDTSKVIVTPKYTGRKVSTEVGGSMIASWTYTWAKVDDLPPGDYSAKIVLTYSSF